MGINIACDWCRQPIQAGDPYVTVVVEGSIVEGHPSNEPKNVGGPARVYCALDRYNDEDTAANGYGIPGQNERWGHRPSCAQRMLAALYGNPEGRADMGLEWRLVAQVAPNPRWLLDGPIASLNVQTRIQTALAKAGVKTVRELARMTEAEWQAIPGITDRGADEILSALHKHSRVKAKDVVARAKAASA